MSTFQWRGQLAFRVQNNYSVKRDGTIKSKPVNNETTEGCDET